MIDGRRFPLTDPFMKSILLSHILFIAFLLPAFASDDDSARLKSLNAYWEVVARSVKEGDFETYTNTCHKEGILVSGIRGNSSPLSVALARWKKEFMATKSGEVKTNLEFRFSRRIGDETTAHETGIFLYSTKKPGGEIKPEYIHFETLLAKREDGWKMVMEYQKAVATEEEWKALKKP
jgi:hypothetical protein